MPPSGLLLWLLPVMACLQSQLQSMDPQVYMVGWPGRQGLAKCQ